MHLRLRTLSVVCEHPHVLKRSGILRSSPFPMCRRPGRGSAQGMAERRGGNGLKKAVGIIRLVEWLHHWFQIHTTVYVKIKACYYVGFDCCMHFGSKGKRLGCGREGPRCLHRTAKNNTGKRIVIHSASSTLCLPCPPVSLNHVSRNTR